MSASGTKAVLAEGRKLTATLQKLAAQLGVQPFILLMCAMFIMLMMSGDNEWGAIGAICILLMYIIYSFRHCLDAGRLKELRALELQAEVDKMANMKRPRRAKLQADQPRLPLGGETKKEGDPT